MHFKMSSAVCFSLDQSKILSSGFKNFDSLFRFANDGLNFSLNSDDPLVFDSCLLDDYTAAMQAGLTIKQVVLGVSSLLSVPVLLFASFNPSTHPSTVPFIHPCVHPSIPLTAVSCFDNG